MSQQYIWYYRNWRIRWPLWEYRIWDCWQLKFVVGSC